MIFLSDVQMGECVSGKSHDYSDKERGIVMRESHDPVRLGLVGLGYWGVKVANAAAVVPEIKITHCFARTQSTREEFAARYDCRPVSSYREMLEDDSVEGVILITPNRVHRDQIMLAVEYRKHIFVDKPITATLEQGVEVVNAVERAGLILAVDQECRREPAMRKMKQALEDGALGRLLMAEANISSSTGLKTHPDEWRAQPGECSGGPLIQIGIHHIDSLQYLLGPITRVQGWQKRQVLEIPMDDMTVTLLEFENGMLGYLGSGYASAYSAWINVYGGAAIGKYDRAKGLRLEGAPAKGTSEDWTAPGASYEDPAPAISDALAEFGACIRSGAQPEVGGREALSALAVVLGAVESGAMGKAVDIKDLLRRAGADW